MNFQLPGFATGHTYPKRLHEQSTTTCGFLLSWRRWTFCKISLAASTEVLNVGAIAPRVSSNENSLNRIASIDMDDQRTVGFTEMKHGTKSDYELLHELEKPFLALTADRVMDELRRQGDTTLEGYKITRLDHALQSATRAHREGADIDWVVGALLHDIGDGLAPQNHDRMSAEVIRPFVREEVSWVVEHHGIFQMLHYGHHYGWDRNARDRYKDHPSFNACAAFCERWDQASFDPDYDSEELDFFEPMVRDVFGRKAHDPEVLRAGYVVGLPESD